MKIMILGAGQVGATLAASLVSENNDITVVDTDAEALKELSERYDIATVCGKASHPSILLKAGAREADMLIAVTASDEVNMVACEIARRLFQTPNRIARIRATEYLDFPGLFTTEHMTIDTLISPEQAVTDHIIRLLETPGALQVLDFANGRIRLIGVRARPDGLLVGHQLAELRQHLPDVDMRVAAIYRRGEALKPLGDTRIEAEDEVFFIAESEDLARVFSEFRRVEGQYRKLVIAGGGHIGERLATALEHNHSITLLELDNERSLALAGKLDHTLVLNGPASDRELLLEAGVADADVFCALTNDDEANIMSSLLAKRMGARKVLTLISNQAYADLVQGTDIDIAISPQQITIGSILTELRQGDVIAVHSLRRGAAEAIEVIAHSDCRIAGKAIRELKLPGGATIGAIARPNEVIMGHDDVRIEPGDHVIVFVTNKREIPEIEKLFSRRRSIIEKITS
ncbi:MAG TPA: Trk system potassium transporter TrkA [Moraxellaceae bacterium]|nr:Trk system potassium transporter TrkA [Moraxellaceae bacterium]